MANTYISVNFYGHGRKELSGVPDEVGFMPSVLQLRREYTLGVVGYDAYPLFSPAVFIYNYNAVLGPENESKAKDLVPRIITGSTAKDPIFLVTGYSSGGVTAIYFARAVNQRTDATLGYLGLADAAFYNPESVGLMTNPQVTGKYRKNYYQTKGNGPDVDEIHGPVGEGDFENFNLDREMTANSVADLHEQACIRGNFYMKNDVIWCVKNYKA